MRDRHGKDCFVSTGGSIMRISCHGPTPPGVLPYVFRSLASFSSSSAEALSCWTVSFAISVLGACFGLLASCGKRRRISSDDISLVISLYGVELERAKMVVKAGKDSVLCSTKPVGSLSRTASRRHVDLSCERRTRNRNPSSLLRDFVVTCHGQNVRRLTLGNR